MRSPEVGRNPIFSLFGHLGSPALAPLESSTVTGKATAAPVAPGSDAFLGSVLLPSTLPCPRGFLAGASRRPSLKTSVINQRTPVEETIKIVVVLKEQGSQSLKHFHKMHTFTKMSSLKNALDERHPEVINQGSVSQSGCQGHKSSFASHRFLSVGCNHTTRLQLAR